MSFGYPAEFHLVVVPRELIDENQSTVHLQMTERLASILQEHRVFFGDRKANQVPELHLDKMAEIEPYTSFFNGASLHTMGVYSYTFSPLARPGVAIGRYCSIAGGVYCMGGQHPINRVTTSNMTFTAHQQHQSAAHKELLAGAEQLFPFKNVYRPPKIEHDVWIGDNVLLREGVTLSTGSIVGGGSVVAKDVPPYAIVVGNPATIKRFRFPPKTIMRLLSSSWWQYHPRVLKEFGATDVDLFLDRFEGAKVGGQLEKFDPEPLTWKKLESALCSWPTEP